MMMPPFTDSPLCFAALHPPVIARDLRHRSFRPAIVQGFRWTCVFGLCLLWGSIQRPCSAESDSPDGEFSVVWTYDTGEAIEATPALASGRVIVADVMGKITAIDQKNGTKIWTQDFGTGFLASPSIFDDKVFIGDFEGNLYAIRVSDGTVVWKKSTEGEINGAAAFYKDSVLVTSQDGNLYRYRIGDGTLQWKYETGDQIRCSPRVVGDRTFLGGCDAKLHVVDLETGKAACPPLPLGGPTGSTPETQGDQVFVPIMDGTVYAFDWKTQTNTWTYEDEETQQEYRSSPAVRDQWLILSSARKQVDALSTKSGQRMWRHTLRRRADASPVIDGDSVFIAGTDGRLIQLNLQDGQPKWTYEIRDSFAAGPAIDGDRIYIADTKGIVRCFAKNIENAGKKTADKKSDLSNP